MVTYNRETIVSDSFTFYILERERILMMKKYGFTLAEVLITLTIIGVVAMMTLPALMTNVQEQQAKTGIKKGINTLTEAAQMNNAVSGFDYSSLANDQVNENAQSIFGLFLSRTQVDNSKSTTQITTDNDGNQTGFDEDNRSLAAKRVLTGLADGTDAPTYTVIFFRDGSALAFRTADTVATGTPARLPVNYQNVGRGFLGYYDVNGEKAPNLLSNCTGTVNSHISTSANPDVAITDAALNANTCDNRQNRVIKDQFTLFFTGANVMPADVATKWAVDN